MRRTRIAKRIFECTWKMNVMNVMNVMNMWKSTTFMPYPNETKALLNVMNVVRKFFACSRTRIANLYFAIALLQTRNLNRL